ncbi:Transmembrane emp24 domain-containing protein p24delta3 [Sesamum angolense]|uniref:Transmembrane emp24 domain-containing protein p24delta3 n=1 Tax=Sesamum angolense TaxID=2727404 RepID=A0AAE1W5V5_9LAMI|nr:Transmembrane emp24 domain-containing protein p24delta3 [Sesamum angolense]
MKLGRRVISGLVVVGHGSGASGAWDMVRHASSGSKCVSEELRNNVVVLADYYSLFGEQEDLNSTVAPTISVKVTSPYGKELYHTEKVRYGWQECDCRHRMENWNCCKRLGLSCKKGKD